AHTEYLRALRWDDLLPDLFPKEQFQIGVVIDPASHLPLTGDYDLMGAFPIDNPGGQALTMVHTDNKRTMKEQAIVMTQTEHGRADLAMATLTKMRNSPYCTEIAKMLNSGFGGRARIMHGAHDLKYDPRDNNEDGCSVFHPQGAFFLPTAAEVERFYQVIGR